MEFSRRELLAAASAASLGMALRLQAQGGSADLLLFNGKIVTVDDAFSRLLASSGGGPARENVIRRRVYREEGFQSS